MFRTVFNQLAFNGQLIRTLNGKTYRARAYLQGSGKPIILINHLGPKNSKIHLRAGAFGSIISQNPQTRRASYIADLITWANSRPRITVNS